MIGERSKDVTETKKIILTLCVLLVISLSGLTVTTLLILDRGLGPPPPPPIHRQYETPVPSQWALPPHA